MAGVLPCPALLSPSPLCRARAAGPRSGLESREHTRTHHLHTTHTLYTHIDTPLGTHHTHITPLTSHHTHLTYTHHTYHTTHTHHTLHTHYTHTPFTHTPHTHTPFTHTLHSHTTHKHTTHTAHTHHALYTHHTLHTFFESQVSERRRLPARLLLRRLDLFTPCVLRSSRPNAEGLQLLLAAGRRGPRWAFTDSPESDSRGRAGAWERARGLLGPGPGQAGAGRTAPPSALCATFIQRL